MKKFLSLAMVMLLVVAMMAGCGEKATDSDLAYIEENGNKFLEKLGYKYENGIYRITKPNDDKVALFCHSAFSRAWVSVLLHIPVHIMWAGFDYEHSGVTIMEFENYENGITAPKCYCYSDTSHLYAEGIGCDFFERVEM